MFSMNPVLVELLFIFFFFYATVVRDGNRPFFGSGQMVRNKLCWDANNAVGLPKMELVPVQPDFPLFVICVPA